MTTRDKATDTILRAPRGSSLTLEEMRASLPTIFAPEKHACCSERYVYISTEDVFGELMARGFVPVEARVSRSGDTLRQGQAKHMVRLRTELDENKHRVGDSIFEVIMRNSHDGSGSYRF